MADFKISQLPEVTSAATGDYVILNSSNSQTNRIDASTLVSAFSSTAAGVRRPIMVNFPDDPGFQFETRGWGHYAADPNLDEDDGVKMNWVKTKKLYDVFGTVAPQQVTMPAGCDEAIVLLTFESYTRTAISITIYNDTRGYANIFYRLNATTNKSTIRWKPGGGASNTFEIGAKMYGPRMPYDGYAGADETKRNRMLPHQGMVTSRSMILKFDESTEDDPTIITFSPFCQVTRMKNSTVGASTGKILIFPYKKDDLDAATASMINSYVLENDIYENNLVDNTTGFDEDYVTADVAAQFKSQMRFISLSLDESLRYDVNIAGGTDAQGNTVQPNQTAITAIETALRDLFELKRSQSTDTEYYENEMKRIVTSVIQYVGFNFAFESPNAVKSF